MVVDSFKGFATTFILIFWGKHMKKVLLLIVFVLIFCVGAVGLYNKINEYKKGEEEYNELEQYFVQSDGISQTQDDNSNNSQDNVSAPTVNFVELLTVNKDIVAWIYIPGTSISYPVVQGQDNSYYVSHTVKGSKNKSGAIFLDCAKSSDFSDTNSIIYGHNLQNGRMFSGLRKFLNSTYIGEHKEIVIYTLNEEIHYNIASAFKVNKYSDIYKKKNIEDKEELKIFFRDVCKLDESIDTANIISLSTCTNVDKDERIVVIAYRDKGNA